MLLKITFKNTNTYNKSLQIFKLKNEDIGQTVFEIIRLIQLRRKFSGPSLLELSQIIDLVIKTFESTYSYN